MVEQLLTLILGPFFFSYCGGVQVAVKIFNRALIEESDERHLLQEVDILKRVHHPNIIRVYETIETKDKIYVVMELAKGGELFDRILAKGHYSEADAKAILRYERP
jgi:calcium/calmodulin-dependent protein kinase I